MAEIKNQQMLQKLEGLKSIVELPKLYLAYYFQELRNKVDLEMVSKQMLHRNDIEMKNKSNQIWIEMISKIDSFEKQCKNKDELQSNSNRIDQIRIMLDNQNELTNLVIIEDKILEEEFNLLKKLFQNKTIIFENILSKAGHRRLVIIDDEYVNWIPLDEMYSFKENYFIRNQNLT